MRYPHAGAPCFIYAIRRGNDGAIKLGATHDLAGRARRLGVSLDVDIDIGHALLAVWRADGAEEAALHRRFAAYRLDGEWFRPSAALELLVTLRGGQGDRRLPAPRLLAADALYRASRILERAAWKAGARADRLSPPVRTPRFGRPETTWEAAAKPNPHGGLLWPVGDDDPGQDPDGTRHRRVTAKDV
jgi:hypothetical protein